MTDYDRIAGAIDYIVAHADSQPGLTIRCGRASSPFGTVFVALTERGVCSLQFVGAEAVQDLLGSVQASWPGADLVTDDEAASAVARRIFSRAVAGRGPISVHIAGTNFQIAVWRALLAIPEGRLASYGDVAAVIGRPRAVRAVGAAVGANPCAFLIPCHRVIRSNGEIGGYRWGVTRKQAIHAWEAAASDGILT